MAFNFFGRKQDASPPPTAPQRPATLLDRPAVAPRFAPASGGAPAPVRTAVAASSQLKVLISAPAATTPGRVYQLQIITRTDEAGPFKTVLTGRGGELEVSEDFHTAMVVLGKPDRKITLIWTNSSSDVRQVNQVLTSAGQAGYELVNVYEASADVIALFYDSSQNSAATENEHRGRMDELFDRLVAKACEMRASDMHFQVGHKSCEVLFRIDGDLRRIETIGRTKAETLSNAVFNFFTDSDGKQVAFDAKGFQDASITREVTTPSGKVYNLKLRYASMPVFPESWDIVLRLLPIGDSGRAKTLQELGYDDIQLRAFDRMLSRPTGMICLVGTTGSGKSTTLQTSCEMLYSMHEGRKLLRTIEDPPEYIIRGARATPVARKQGENDEASAAGFAQALKQAMRGDPDSLMIGEVRDEVTAKLLQRAVQTGHKVLTTLHAGNPFDAVDRFVDLGIRRSVIASSEFISGIIYQRLIQVLCTQCCVPLEEVRHTLQPDFLRRIELTVKDVDALRFRGRVRDCPGCGGSGVTGRTVVAEILIPDRQSQQFIVREDSISLSAYWRSGQMKGDLGVNGRTALDQAIQKMAAGIVSPVDVEHELGHMTDQETPEVAKRWYETNHQTGVARNP
jgi:general secretion pathway protein E